jgi:hypothetical protein
MRIEFSLDDQMVFIFWIRFYYVAINLNEFNLILDCLDMKFQIKDLLIQGNCCFWGVFAG